MPVIKCSNGKYRIGSGACIYDSKEKAESAYRGYLASKNENMKYEISSLEEGLKLIGSELNEQKKIVIKYDSNK